jgi:acyl carrier protein
MDTVKATIRDYVVREAQQAGHEEEITDETNLVEEEILDSLGIFAMISFLEETFNVDIDADEVVLKNFETLPAVEQLVTSKLG